MTYQVLARKWRPKTFAELVGQEHVVTALTNALTNGRLHHAYLLTGTRGVGKTTIARILAKSLNCMTNGVSAAPCGTCQACTEIDTGRFVDLLELDAASHTGIDNMREILDNARYAPTAGRYKVYLIDEVHMLSKAAFNSMLKTLEEPPEHVKFVLATTDPQKIPITVLSRCLQFNLKQHAPPLIASHLQRVLVQEGVDYDHESLELLARAAQGSMRDGLSLLDQAIAYGGGKIEAALVRQMLGAVEREYLWRLLDALAARDGKALLAESASMAERNLSFDAALQDLATLLHTIAIAQTVPEALEVNVLEREYIERFAGAFSAEDVQLYYQIATTGRADLALAPDEYAGFTMTLLRMLAFAPASEDRGPEARRPTPARAALKAERTRVDAPGAANEVTPQKAADAPLSFDGDWPALTSRLPVTGLTQQLAKQSELHSYAGGVFSLVLPEAHNKLAEPVYQQRLQAALAQVLGTPVRVTVELTHAVDSSAAAQEKRERAQAQTRAEQAFKDDPFVQELVRDFDARIKSDSIQSTEQSR